MPFPSARKNTCNLINYGRIIMDKLGKINTIAQYQLVFSKIKSAVLKLSQLARNKEFNKKYRAIHKFKELIQSNEKSKVKSVVEIVKWSLKNILKIKKEKEDLILEKFLFRWQGTVNRLKAIKQVTKRLATTGEKHKRELNGKDHNIDRKSVV